MKVYKIAFEHTGEISYTAKTPSRVYEESMDLTETKSCIWSSDDWRQTSVLRWEIREVVLPDWLDPWEWIANAVKYKYLWGINDMVKHLPELHQRYLLSLEMADRYAAAMLLTTKSFRSSFRKSLCDQLIAWIETPVDQRKYKSPFSVRQWQSALGPHGHTTVKRIETQLYRDTDNYSV